MGRQFDSVKHRYQRILEESNAYKRFHQILIKTKNEQNFLKAFDLANDRAWGKADQHVDMRTEDVTDRPSTDVLIETLTVLRKELDALRTGTGVATKE